MFSQFARTELIFGGDAMQKLNAAKVAVFGIGGVGGYTAEALARTGISKLDLFDNDTFCLTNLNRQLHATHKTIGQYKVDVAKERILEINPNATVSAFKVFYLPETSAEVDLSGYSYVVDAIDTVSGKIELAVRCAELAVPLISSMGAGNKINAAMFEVADIYKTAVCPLAKVMRRELGKRGVEHLKVVYSKEVPRQLAESPELKEQTHKRQIPGSNAFVPAVAGLIIAGEVVKDLAEV
jgi:tRNA A37 threonylcarbamoyladenosine dehydratase